MSLDEEQVAIVTPDGFTLDATLVHVKEFQRLAVLCHGINSDKDEYLEMFTSLAGRLAQQGVSSIRFSFRGHGNSSGRSADFGVVAQMIDLASILEWVKHRLDGVVSILDFVGASFGAAPGIFWNFDNHEFSTLSLIAPVLSYRRTFLEPETEWARSSFHGAAIEDAWRSGSLLLDGEFNVGVRLLEEMRLLRPDAALGSLEQRVLLIHGSADAMVPPAVSQGVAKRFDHVDLRLIPDMGHGLYCVGDDEGATAASANIAERVLGLIAAEISDS